MSIHRLPPLENDAEPLTDAQIAALRDILIDRQLGLMGQRSNFNNEEERTADELDVATGEYEKTFGHRLRDRERGLLAKIGKALRRIEAGEYDECESCGDLIGIKRLSARPEASMCIGCKEEQELLERRYMKRRHREDDTFFTF